MNLFLWEFSLVGWQSGFLAKTGEITSQEHVTIDSHVGEEIVPGGDSALRTRSSNYTLALVLRLRNNHGKTSVRVIQKVPSWLVKSIGHGKMPASTGLLNPVALGLRVKRPLSTLKQRSYLPSYRNKDSPHQLTLSQNTRLGL